MVSSVVIGKEMQPEGMDKEHRDKIKEVSKSKEFSKFRDIYLDYGYGVVTFFFLLKSLIKILLFITFFVALPQIYGFWLVPL